ncbi:DNA alkylation repair protein [Parasphingorhabdus sp.]|uniref:DNA alkylation repair protein n=1 Tax=Parasphingorhabdus sp. TaxID=2709688 RepID=UPI003D2DEB1D
MERNSENILAELRNLATKNAKEVAKRRLVPVEFVMGTSTGVTRKLAKSIGPDEILAEALWTSPYYEARILAILIFPLSQISTSQLERWLDGINDWSICDLFVKTLALRSPHISMHFQHWTKSDNLYRKRAGLALIANHCMRSHKLSDDLIAKIEIVLRYSARDNRKHVRQACCWALREFGKIDDAMREKAIELATDLLENNDCDSKWVARCAIKELETLIKTPERRRLISRQSKTARLG